MTSSVLALPNAATRREALETLPHVAFVLGPSGRLVCWNQTAERVTGVARADVLGTKLTESFSGLQAVLSKSDIAKVQRGHLSMCRIEGLLSALDPTNTMAGEALACRLSGAGREVLFVAWSAPGVPFAEHREIVSHGSWRVDLDRPLPMDLSEDDQIQWLFETGYLADCDQQLADMYGYESHREMVGLRLHQLWTRSDVREEGKLRAVIRAGYEVDGVRSIEIDNRGQLRSFCSRLAGTVRDGFVTSLHGHQVDITEEMRADNVWRVLFQVSQATSRHDNLGELLAEVHHSLSKLIDTTNFYVALYDAKTQTYSFPYDIDSCDGDDFTTGAHNLDRSLTDYVRRMGEPMLLFGDHQQRLVRSGQMDVYGAPCRTWLGAPLRTPTGVIGVVAVQSYVRDDLYTEDDLHVLTVVSDFIALAIERTRNVERLRVSEERFALAAAGASDGLWDWDLRTGQVYFSPRWREMVGVSDSDMTWNDWLGRVHSQDIEGLKLCIEQHIAGKTEHLLNEHRILRGNGRWRWVLARGACARDENGQAVRMAGSLMDIHDRKDTEARLRYDADHDQLTGLPNRAVLMRLLQRAIQRKTEEKDYKFAVLLLDLDRFKVINDSLGHVLGDQLLVSIARRLKSCVRPGDTVARLGGDEFTLLLDDISGAEDALRIARRVRAAVMERFTLSGHEVFTTASVGIAMGMQRYVRPEALLRDADTAMYQAKSGGKDCFVVFDEEMRSHVIRQHQLERDLRRAVEQKEFCVFYQPIVNLQTGKMVGLEALARWRHPTEGLVSPGEFISLAEETGLIVPIGQMIMDEAVSQLVEWHKEYSEYEHLGISVNVSGRQFGQTDLVEDVRGVLERTGLTPGKLCLEITESAVIENVDQALPALNRLREMDVPVYMDDFGKGYSSLSYLYKLPVHTLKVDRAFVTDVHAGSEKFAMIQTIVSMARTLRLPVIAEGVETKEDLQMLRELGCDYAQGYLFARPGDADDVRKLLARHPSW